MSFRTIFANISQEFVFAGEKPGEQNFSRFSPQEYLVHFQQYNPDILCLAEVLMDENGKSEFVSQVGKKLQLPYIKTLVNEKSWLSPGNYYGLAFLSQFPIVDYKTFFLPHPKLEVIRPDGAHWILHDKGAQKITINTPEKKLTIFNLHYFPFHHFGRRMDEPEFEESREAFVNIFQNTSDTTIICGDFNNKYVSFGKAFPELEEKFTQAIKTKTTLVGGEDQLDHILYTKDLNVLESKAEAYLSDHYMLCVDFE